jgi:predicted Zn-dependent protease
VPQRVAALAALPLMLAACGATHSQSSDGGLLANAAENERRESASFASQIKRYRALTRTQQSNLSAWEHLTEALLHEAGGEAYVTTTGRVTRKGKELFGEAARSWQSYLGLNPPQPNANLAQVVLAIYAPGRLNQPAQAVRVLQILVHARPNSAARYAELAQYAYKAKKPGVGDRASKKAVSLAPSAARSRLRKELEDVKRR